MKNKETITKHLTNVAYTRMAHNRIIGFLLGCGLINKGEIIKFRRGIEGEEVHGFDFFYEWFNTVSSKDVLNSLFEDLNDRRAWAIENEKWDLACRTSLQIECLVDLLPSMDDKKKADNKKSE